MPRRRVNRAMRTSGGEPRQSECQLADRFPLESARASQTPADTGPSDEWTPTARASRSRLGSTSSKNVASTRRSQTHPRPTLAGPPGCLGAERCHAERPRRELRGRDRLRCSLCLRKPAKPCAPVAAEADRAERMRCVVWHRSWRARRSRSPRQPRPMCRSRAIAWSAGAARSGSAAKIPTRQPGQAERHRARAHLAPS